LFEQERTKSSESLGKRKKLPDLVEAVTAAGDKSAESPGLNEK